MWTQEWEELDLFPDVRLDHIPVGWLRAHSLICRNKEKPLVKGNVVALAGAVEMLKGMEYHHSNFVRYCDPLIEISTEIDRAEQNLRHEAVAYVNRLRQFETFLRSDLVTETGLKTVDIAPTFNQLVIFRNKHAAHRSIDSPRKTDTPTTMISHALSLSIRAGSLYVPRERPQFTLGYYPWSRSPGETEDIYSFKKHARATRIIRFQLQTSDSGDYVDFTMETDHPKLMNESVAAMAHICNWEQL